MSNLDRNTLYDIHQKNIHLLEMEMEITKKTTQNKLGQYLFFKKNHDISSGNSSVNGKLKRYDEEILGCTRLYTFLLCSWLESRLHKILYEASSVAFTDSERLIVRRLTHHKDIEIEKQWKICFNLALCKSFGIAYSNDINKLATKSPDLFTSCPSALRVYDKVFDYLELIKGAVSVRNRLAHGQWEIQLNSSSTNYASVDIKNFLNRYSNIMELDLLFNMFKEISDIISSYVTYKDKHSNRQADFDKKIDDCIDKIETINSQLNNKKFDKYCKIFLRKYTQQQKIWKNN